jgi:predicted acylesterase/phospholipase RssA
MIRVEPADTHRGSQPDDIGAGHELDAVGEDEVAERLADIDAGSARGGHPLAEHLTAMASNRWTARMPSRGVFIPTWRIRRVLQDLVDPGVARVRARLALERDARERVAQIDVSEGQFRDNLNLVWASRGDATAPHAADVALLVEVHELIGRPGARGGFGERSLLVELAQAEPGAPAGVWARRDSAAGPVEVGTLTTRPERALADLIALIRDRPSVSNVVSWGTGFGLDLQAAADTVLLMNHDPTMALPGWPTVSTAVQVANLVRAHPLASLPPATARLHGLLETPTPSAGMAGRDELLGRWARTLTHRRVGVALGGGGAWGWAHLALIEGMHERSIPIDVLSGASFGAVAGGLYALGGLPGLTWALQHDGRLQLATDASMVLGWPMERLLDRLVDELVAWTGTDKCPLHGEERSIYLDNLRAMKIPGSSDPAIRLTHLPLPFYPVATELITGSEAPLWQGTVGHGVKASGSLPPVFPTTRTAGATFADGGLSRNVPANVLLLEGAALIVGSNIVPPPFITPTGSVARGRVGRTATALDPFRRGVDAVVGAQTLFNQAGAVDTGLSPVLFQTAWNGNMFFQISRGEDIVEDTRGERAFWQAMTGLSRRWTVLGRPRRGIGPVASAGSAAGPAQGGQGASLDPGVE